MRRRSRKKKYVKSAKRTSINQYRPLVFKLYMLLFALCIGTLLSVAALYVSRKPIEEAAVALRDKGIPTTWQMLREDPWVVFLFLFVAGLLWCIPWDEFQFPDPPQQPPTSRRVPRPPRQRNVYRGRHQGYDNLANHDAMQHLIRQRRQRRRRK